jgi:hypothetical protein
VRLQIAPLANISQKLHAATGSKIWMLSSASQHVRVKSNTGKFIHFALLITSFYHGKIISSKRLT